MNGLDLANQLQDGGKRSDLAARLAREAEVARDERPGSSAARAGPDLHQGPYTPRFPDPAAA